MVRPDNKVATVARAAKAMCIRTMSFTTSMIIMSICHRGRGAKEALAEEVARVVREEIVATA
jgi:hypothetical protein